MKLKSMRVLALVIAVITAASLPLSALAASRDGLTEEGVYNAMIALMDEYPEGMPWTNDNFYAWHGGIFSGGYGCAGFAFLLSDAAFGDLPARWVEPVVYADLRVGDIVRVNGDTHSVILLEVRETEVVVAEGNYNSSIHWGRHISKANIEAGDYVLTRWPEGEIPGVLGDADGDGSVSIQDALLVLRYSMGLVGPDGIELENADFDGNGSVEMPDALAILRRAMGLI